MWIRFLLLFCFVFGTSASCFGASVNWNASIVDAEHGAPDGYRVYYGSASDQLTTVWDNGGSTVFDIPDMWAVGTYYFGVRAYNASGESGWATTPEGQTRVSYVKAEPPPVEPPEPATDVQIVWEQTQEPPIMAFGLINSASSANEASGSSIATGSAISLTAGKAVLVAVFSYMDSGSPRTATVADTPSNTYTKIATFTNFWNSSLGNGCALELFYASNITSHASAIFTATYSGACIYRHILVVQLDGLATSSVYDSGYTPNGNEDSASPYTNTSATISGSGEVIIGFGFPLTDPGTISASSPSGILKDFDGSPFFYREVGAGSYSAAFASSVNTTFAIVARAFVLATGGASAVPVIMRSYRARRN